MSAALSPALPVPAPPAEATHVGCPQPGCQALAEVLQRFTLASTHGPSAHLKVRCPGGHWFAGCADRLVGSGAEPR